MLDEMMRRERKMKKTIEDNEQEIETLKRPTSLTTQWKEKETIDQLGMW